jgi:hypothetical protein
MNIDKAKQLKVGNIVQCPPDRGDEAYSGFVTHTGETVYLNIHDEPFIWVTVRHHSQSAVWPSNRL